MTTKVTDSMQATPAVAFKKFYQSPNITISSGLVIPQAHGFVGAPTLVRAHLLCLTGELGYSSGDNAFTAEQTASGGVLLSADAVNITAALQALPSIPNKSSGTPGTITAANWKLVLRGWQ